jgi:hypothetical protein
MMFIFNFLLQKIKFVSKFGIVSKKEIEIVKLKPEFHRPKILESILIFIVTMRLTHEFFHLLEIRH